MKTYDNSHWVTDRNISGKTSIEVMEAIASDLSEAKQVLSELTAWYHVEGTTGTKLGQVADILEGVFNEPVEQTEGSLYHKAQVRSSYVIALAAHDLNVFMSEAVAVMLAHIEEHGFNDSEQAEG